MKILVIVLYNNVIFSFVILVVVLVVFKIGVFFDIFVVGKGCVVVVEEVVKVDGVSVVLVVDYDVLVY